MISMLMAGVAMAGMMDETAKTEAIESVLRVVDKGYSYPEVGEQMVKAVRERQSKGDYREAKTGTELADRLTRDLQSVSHDRHLRVSYSEEKLPPDSATILEQPADWVNEARKTFAPQNFGLVKTEILEGNVGYLDFRFFAPLEVAADTYDAAMALVANTDALIVDVRQNGGSMSPETLPYLIGYFFEKPVHLINMTWRFEGMTRQLWTAPHVAGKRYLSKPIYVLTSGRTFSGAEEFAYDLQALKRATLVGEVTGGGANPGGTLRANDHFVVWLPMGRVENAVTGKNWEGVGVQPDVKVTPLAALAEAHSMALSKLGRTAEAVEKPKVKTVRFTLAGYPKAEQVYVAGSFNYWSDHATPLRKDGGKWVVDVPVVAGKATYKFVVDGQWMPDPGNAIQTGPNKDSVLIVE